MPTPPTSNPDSRYRAWRRQTALCALLLFAITLLVLRIPGGLFPLRQVQTQDALPLFVLSISLFVAAFWTPRWRLPSRAPKPLLLGAMAILAIGMLAHGTYAIMGNFPLSIDERMVVFDMAVFDRGRLAAPLAPEWRSYVNALFSAPLLSPNMPTGVVSSYLPMNALLRLGFSKLANPALFDPLLAVAGGAALWDIAKRTFGKDDPACWVVLLVYALSAQMLANAMTVYSMTAHMALNIIWLAAFLRGGRMGHSAAILIGFVATGLHQLAFHPFFVAPFLLWRLHQGHWKVVVTYAVAYAAIILWWAGYPTFAAHEVASGLANPPETSLMSRIATAFAERRGDTLLTTILNVLRFLAWQNLALLPLLIAAGTVVIKDRGLPAVLMLGIGLWMAFITIVIPFQGLGWGYRYLHPYLGSFALLAGYGYRQLSGVIGQRTDGVVLSLSTITAGLTIPSLLLGAHRVVEPYLSLDRLIADQRTPMVLVDTDLGLTTRGGWSGNAIEDVYNLPDLSNRPLRLSSMGTNAELLENLCRRGKITLITRRDQRRVGFPLVTEPDSPRFAEQIQSVGSKMPGCFVSASRRR